MSSFCSNPYDDTLDPIIRDILPEVENSLRDQALKQMQQQFQTELQHEYARIQSKAKEEYELALEELEEEASKMEQEDTHHLLKQLEKVRREKETKEDHHLRALQDRYISENFNELIMSHPRISELGDELEKQIREEVFEKMEAAKQRKVKELLVKLESKQQKERKDRDKFIKSEIYGSGGLEELKKDIQVLRIGIASMKSEYNLKIKKVETQIKSIKQKNKTLQPTEDLSQLRQKLASLQAERDRINQQILEQQPNHNQSYSRNFSHLDSSSDYSILRHPPNEHQMVHEDIVMESEEEGYSSSDQSSCYDQDIVRPPIYQPSYQEPYEESVDPAEAPILDLDVGKLLRSNWQRDPLQKYLTDETGLVSKENESVRSNFQQLYRQHLERLNKGGERRKLSFNAKKTIIRNLGLLNRNKSN